MFLWIVTLIVLLLYVLLDVHYFVRVAITYLYAKFGRKKISIVDPSVIYGIYIKLSLKSRSVFISRKNKHGFSWNFSGVVLPSDTDFLLSFMTNSRYLREYDFARFDHATRSGLMDFVLKKGGSFPVSAVHMRYRLPAMLFSPYKVS
jgi:hypothetical protein